MRSMRSLYVALVAVTVIGAASAQEFRTKVVARDLSRPTGIAVSFTGRVYFTELPTPGVGGADGGKNRVNVLNSRNGRVTNLTKGEPEPTNLATNLFGDVYWTCKSAGVILTLDGGKGDAKLVANELNKPSGVAAYPLGLAIFFTEVPTPGVSGANGGKNTVSALLEGIDREFLLNEGDPEPTDVVVDLAGNLYWTCTSAGVILKLSAGKTEVIARGLNKPTGIATDYLGNLYFTEVPTPGVSGANGGKNRVSMLKLKTGAITVIDEGDPDPVDVTVTPFGSTVYWTCRSAGVIVQATPKR
ncbi:MAG: hypothetical protein MUF18_00990 [Fimbriiglobus sp.]|nr:hypothetical protein [Fimbriiglobus sp.]